MIRPSVTITNFNPGRGPFLRAVLMFAAFMALTAIAHAAEEYTAIASDPATGRVGAVWHQASQADADAAAPRRCGAPGCEIRVRGGLCGAFAATPDHHVFSGGIGPTRAHARHEAVRICRLEFNRRCFVRISGCPHHIEGPD